MERGGGGGGGIPNLVREKVDYLQAQPVSDRMMMLLVRERHVAVQPLAKEAICRQPRDTRGIPCRDQVDLWTESRLAVARTNTVNTVNVVGIPAVFQSILSTYSVHK